MTFPWNGSARRAEPGDFVRAAGTIGCDVAAIMAIWQVEAAGAPYRKDGSVERRFEPHKLAVPEGNYKTSSKLSRAERERKFAAAYARDAEDAMRATSWGAPQIMGFNHAGAGFGSARDMVAAMAESEARQIDAFVALVKFFGVDGALRSHDWSAFARGWNGNADVKNYSAKVEKAYRELSGSESPVVLRSGSKGAAVKRLQTSLGVNVDGSFGPETLQAVRDFQRESGLPIDGVVGQRTWEALERDRDAAPVVQPTKQDLVAKATELASIGGAGASAVATVFKALPEASVNVLIVAVAVFSLAALGLFALRKVRGVA